MCAGTLASVRGVWPKRGWLVVEQVIIKINRGTVLQIVNRIIKQIDVEVM